MRKYWSGEQYSFSKNSIFDGAHFMPIQYFLKQLQTDISGISLFLIIIMLEFPDAL